MKKLLTAALLLFTAGFAVAQNPNLATVTLQDTLYLADGTTVFTGVLDVQWPTFTLNGQRIGGGEQQIQVTRGALTVNLWPSDQALVLSPDTGQQQAGFVYRVTASTPQGPMILFWWVGSNYVNTTVALSKVQPAWVTASGSAVGFVYIGLLAGIPATCTVGQVAFITNATAGQNQYNCTSTNVWTQNLNSGSGGASTALGNLAAVSINTSLLAQAGVDLGSTTNPFRNLFIYGAGSYGTNYFELLGTPTGGRQLTLPDATGTLLYGGGPLGTPLSGTATNITGLPAAGLASVSADNIFGNFTASPAIPTTQALPACANDGVHAVVYPSHTLTCESIANLPNASLTNSSTTFNGQAVALGATGNVNTGAAAHSVAINEGAGAAIAAATIGTSGRALLDQGAGADPAFEPISGDGVLTNAGVLTISKLNSGSVPASAAVLGTNSSSQPIATTAHGLKTPLACSDSSGSGTTQVCTTSPTFVPAAGDTIIYTTTTQNSGALTINVNSSSAIAAKKWQGTALASGDLKANVPMLMTYDGTNWELYTVGNAPAGGSGCTASGGAGVVQASNGSSGCQATTITDNGTTVAITEPLTATSFSSGSSAPTSSVCGPNGTSPSGLDCYGEGNTPIGTLSSVEVIWATTGHRLNQILNGTNDSIVGAATTDTFTNKTFDTAGSGNAFKINGTSISAVNGTGNVLLSAGTAAITTGKTFTLNNSLTFSGTDGTTITTPATSATMARTDAAQTFTGIQTFNTAIAPGSGGTGCSITNVVCIGSISGNFSADNILGNFTGSSATPSTQAIPSCANDGAHGLVYVSHVLTCASITGGGGGTGQRAPDFLFGAPSYTAGDLTISSSAHTGQSFSMPGSAWTSHYLVLTLGTTCTTTCYSIFGIWNSAQTTLLCATAATNMTGALTAISIPWATGSDVSGGVCTLPGATSGYLLVMSSESTTANVLASYDASAVQMMNANYANSGAGATATAVTTGSGASLAFVSSLSGLTWTAIGNGTSTLPAVRIDR